MSTHTPIPGTEGTDAQGHHIPAEHLTNGYTHPNQILQAGHCYHHTDYGNFLVAEIFTDTDGTGHANTLDTHGLP